MPQLQVGIATYKVRKPGSIGMDARSRSADERDENRMRSRYSSYTVLRPWGNVMRQRNWAACGKRKRGAWKAAWAGLWLCLLIFVNTTWSLPTHAQKLSDKWAPLSPAEFETYRPLFLAYDIESYRSDIVVLNIASLKIFRLESPDFCAGTLCLTILISVCGKSACPSTTVFAKRDVEFVNLIAGYFDGRTQFLEFRLSKDRSITVMMTKRFISVSRGLGED
jgi:hypothetical protein